VARIEVGSIDTGIQKRDDHLRSADFFNIGKFPEITFQSRSVKRTGDHEGDIAGDLTMHGVKRPIVLHVRLLDNPPGEKTKWKVTTAPLKRSEFGLEFSPSAEAISGIAQDVSINIEVEASRGR
jgi:polyisoprenoid-binding protein YceI